MLPRTMDKVFSRIDDNSSITCIVKVSMLEIYQEQLNDLLERSYSTYSKNNSTYTSSSSSNQQQAMTVKSSSSSSSVPIKDTMNKGLRIRENEDGLIWVENLREVVVNNSSDFMSVLSLSLKRRVVGSHSMNHVSSRSHLLCIINLQQLDFQTGML